MVVKPVIKDLTTKYQGKLYMQVYVELSAGDSMEPLMLDPFAYEVRVVMEINPIGTGKVSQSWQDRDTDPVDLRYQDWDPGAISATYVDYLVPGNWLTASCSAGSLRFHFVIWG